MLKLCSAFATALLRSLIRDSLAILLVFLSTLAEAVTYYEENAPRGEYVLVVEGAQAGDTAAEAFWQDMSIPEHVSHYVGQGMSKKDAIKAAAKDRGVPKNEVYQAVLD